MKTKNKFAYCVFCNPEPKILYAVFSNKKSALKYAHSLINYRFDRAFERKWKHGFYHYFVEDKMPETDIERREKTIFSACLNIEDNAKFCSENGCYIQVIRKPLLP